MEGDQLDDSAWITQSQRKTIVDLGLPAQSFPQWVSIGARVLLIDLQIYCELEIRKLKTIAGFEGVKSCYSLVSWGSKPETVLLGRYESQWTLYGNLRKRHTSDKSGQYSIGDIIGITPRFIEEGIGRDAFELVTFWVCLSYYVTLTLVGQYSSGLSGQVRP